MKNVKMSLTLIMTLMMANRVAEIWSEYQDISNQQNGLLKRIIFVNPVLECYIGFIPLTRSKVFQLKLENQSPVTLSKLPKFSGVEVQILTNLSNQRFYTVILLIDELSHVFTLFIEDVLHSLEFVGNEGEAIKTIGLRINHWKDLFAKLSGDTLTPEQQRGLYGELLILELLLQSLPDRMAVLNAWQGPHGGNHDFTLNEVALEVKTTKAGSPSLGISNEMQLDYAGWKALFVSLVVLTEVKGGVDSLSGLIRAIQLFLSEDTESSDFFRAKLQLAGIPDDMIDGYKNVGYHVRALRHFHVREGFPSIITTDIPDAVSEVRYQVDVSGCLDFETDESFILNSLL
jgi:hypothetical protein